MTYRNFRSFVILLCSLLFCVSVSAQTQRVIKVPQGGSSTSHTKQSSTNKGNIKVPQGGNVSSTRKVLSGPEIFKKYNNAVFMVHTPIGQGSGFFVRPNIAVSNQHVVDGTNRSTVRVKLADGKFYSIRIIKESKKNDFVVFEVLNYHNKVWIPISYAKPKVGEKCYAIGSPLGLENTFSSGEISQIRDDYFIQISVPIDHGSSGGVLLNAYGKAIGITTAGIDKSGANLNFAKRIIVIKKILDSISQ